MGVYNERVCNLCPTLIVSMYPTALDVGVSKYSSKNTYITELLLSFVHAVHVDFVDGVHGETGVRLFGH